MGGNECGCMMPDSDFICERRDRGSRGLLEIDRKGCRWIILRPEGRGAREITADILRIAGHELPVLE
jgi:hypothetical protein